MPILLTVIIMFKRKSKAPAVKIDPAVLPALRKAEASINADIAIEKAELQAAKEAKDNEKAEEIRKKLRYSEMTLSEAKKQIKKATKLIEKNRRKTDAQQ